MQEGSGNGRRLSFKQPSPNLSNASFMPVNTNSKVNQTGSPYGFQPMSNSQPSLTTMNGSTNADAANAALVAAGAMSGMLPQMTVPQPTSMGFAPVDGGKSGEHGQLDNTFGALSPPPVEGHTEGVGGNHNAPGNHSHHGSPPVGSSGNPNPKPQVGTEEWHRVRRDNHKEGTSPSFPRNIRTHNITRVIFYFTVLVTDRFVENPVERRRRETINEGINELAKIVPGCEKNKGSILQRAVQYIQQLKENEAANIEKWTVEKILTEQAISELSANNEKLQKECERAWREAETWKKSCLQAGVTRDSGTPGGSS